MSRIIDARGLNCPEPVILTKRAMDEGQVDRLVTIVDRDAALENVTKLAKSQGFEVEVENKEGDYYITMIRSGQMAAEATDIQEDVAVLVTNRYLGQGSDELGAVLMRSFLYTLSELKDRVKNIIFMNSGVFLTTEGSEVLEILQGLSQDGVKILSCGTCLDFYGLKDKLAVGEVTNMYTATEILSRASRSITL
ncbi:MAG TPA: sulfurtransferase-like selenium metabolism protein YedF [Syntrophomonadaceae bacterium]|nr:sulfurtransferase-like selenium metabolism protein YedF [Syntrophomonadaceae bacterium]HOQ09025.1 sulfurtransferase-like selenium metabolism protein YedF [Syntrophomonadaceae bacterium]HPU47947.1 sulfurtransferase-like selenium metabolism protein YedF [Syntrophomonadaceae bacterium]